ncbi:MAG: hypothetical protein GVY19_06760 [Bacteroidetes bacterium]|jgi:hypothetical protein|nr:hypothetical protein [Bacteroidota bacterium]
MKSTLLLLLFGIILVSTIGSKRINDSDYVKQATDTIRLNDLVINNTFELELRSFISIIDSLPRSKELQNVITITFNHKNYCEITLSSNYYYDFEELVGFFVFNDYLLAFYENNECTNNLLCKSLLVKEAPRKYKHVNNVIYKPYNATYKKIILPN